MYDIIGLFFVPALDCTLFLTFKYILISLQIPKVYTSSAIENRPTMFDAVHSECIQFLYENISPVNDWRSVQPHRICETAIFNCWRLEFRGRERVAFRKFHFPLTNRGTMCIRRGHRIARSWRSNLLVGAHCWAGPKRRATGGAEEKREPAKEREREGKLERAGHNP